MRVFVRRIYLLALVFVLIGGFNTMVGLRHLEGQLRGALEETITFQLDELMGETSLRLLNVEKALDLADVVIAMGTDEAKVIQFFDDILRDNASFLAMYFGASQDYVLYANRDFFWEPVDPTTRPWYQAATREGKTIVTHPYVDAAADRWVLTMAKPVYDENGELVGVLGVDESLEGMLESLEAAKPSEHGHVFAFDATGHALLDSQMHEGNDVPLDMKLIKHMLSESKGLLFTTVGGKEGYLRWEAVGSSGIVLGLFAPLRDFLDFGVLMAQVTGTTLLSLVVASIFIFFFQKQFITEPMRQLESDIMAISLDTDVTYRLPDRKRSPFEQLRAIINVALDRVQEHFESILQQQEELTAAYGQLVAHEKQLQEQYQEIKSDEEHIQFLADHDLLTGLANRRKFEEDLEILLDAGTVGSILHLDLDNFKHINDTLGHVYGDMVLCHLAHTLKNCLEASARAYRFGGDEFLVVLEEVVDPEDLRTIVRQLLHELRQPQMVEGRRNHLTASIGVVRFPYDGTSVEQLLIKADIAMYDAKRRGRNRYAFFEASMSADFAQRVHMQHILSEAVQTGGFRLLYQPIIDVSTGEIAYFEALIRLKDHNLSPAVFIAAAEESDLIHTIGRWVIKEAIGQLADWQTRGIELKPISINLSPRQFYDEGLVDFLVQELKTHRVDPSLIEMEITETVLIDGASTALAIIENIRNLGVKMALDDFGTGYLSIKYITSIPVDRIKLDYSMTHGLPETLPVLEGLIRIAHTLGMDVVAEGIEEKEQALHLAHSGCDYLQGFLISGPMGADQLEPMLEMNFRKILGLKGSA